MEKEFIPYELALRLKELGFDEPCFGFYDNGYLNIVNVRNGNMFKTNNGCFAPTFSQAFRWFREKYGLGHMINGIGYESFIMNIGGVLHIFNAFDFETYEEAELACIDKLIEIVESKLE